MTKLICPHCQSKIAFEEAAREGLYREMVGLASRFGSSWELASEYVDCFRQTEFGCVRLNKKVRLLKELWKLFETNEFGYQGKRYRVDWALILAAINVTISADKWGFKNHNYLKRIMMKDAKKLSAEGLTAEEEEQREALRRSELKAHSSKGNPATNTGGQDMTAQEFKSLHKITGDLVDQIGKTQRSEVGPATETADRDQRSDPPSLKSYGAASEHE